MSVKIAHCADIHIGFSSGKRYATRRKTEVLQTFLRALSYAESEGADLFLIAGDLFDNHTAAPETLSLISSAFEKFSGEIFIVPGNHDYYAENTFWDAWALPQNVTIFKTDGEATLNSLGVKIFGSGFTSPYKFSSPLADFKADPDFINIALVHGDAFGTGAYCPIKEREIAESRMDYVALGHIHKRSGILKAADTAYAYCGCLEGQGFDETGDCGIYIGTVEKGKADLSFVPLSSRCFLEERIDISEALTSLELSELILRKIKEKYGEGFEENLYKITLIGETALSFSVSDITAAVGSRLYYVKIKDATTAPIGDFEALAGENSIKGIFARKMLSLIDENPSEITKAALKLGFAAFDGEVLLDED